MEQNELKLLEDKTNILINAFKGIKDERDKLLKVNEDQSNEINELRSKISILELERNEIKKRIEGIISKIDEINAQSTKDPENNDF